MDNLSGDCDGFQHPSERQCRGKEAQRAGNGDSHITGHVLLRVISQLKPHVSLVIKFLDSFCFLVIALKNKV